MVRSRAGILNMPVLALSAWLLGASAAVLAQPPGPSLQYLGCSAFVITEGSTAIGLDFWVKDAFRYPEDVPPELGVTSESGLARLLISHRHADHGYIPAGMSVLQGVVAGTVVENATLARIGGMSIGCFPALHNPIAEGRTPNAVFLIQAGGIRILHLGDAFGTMADLGALQELKQKVGDVDLLLMPIGSPQFTAVAYEVLERTMATLQPRVTVPMHYWSLAQKQAFLASAAANGHPVAPTDPTGGLPASALLPPPSARTIWNVVPSRYAPVRQ